MATPQIYTTTAMMTVLHSLRSTAPRFLLDTFFPMATFSDTEEIAFDAEDDDIELAPFVSPLVAGRVGADKGYQTRFFAPAYIKPLHDLKPNEVLRRTAGEPLGGSLTAEQRRQLILGQKLQRQMQQILRRKEVMASEVLRTGRCIVKGVDYPETQVDFGRDPSLTVALAGAARWGEAGVSPYDDVQGWLDLVGAASGAAATHVVMEAKAWALYAADPKLEKRLDTTLNQTGSIDLGYQPGVPGTAVYRGRIGQVTFWTYNDTYKDAGVSLPLLPDFTVIVSAAAAAEGVQAHGAILDEDAGYQSVEMFPKTWVEPNPSRRYLLTQSAPLVYQRRPNATACFTVR